MILSKSTGALFLLLLTSIFAAGAAVIVAAVYVFPLAIDEAYITYSHTRNFAQNGRLVYHPANPKFTVTAPLHALLLGLGGAAGIPVPTLSNVLGAASIFGSSAYLTLLCFRHSLNWAGSAAGMLVVTSPALWLTLGQESSFLLLLVLAAYYQLYRGSSWPRRFSRRWPS